MGIGSKVIGFLKESWAGIMSPGPADTADAHHRAGFETLHFRLTGTNMPAAGERAAQRTLDR